MKKRTELKSLQEVRKWKERASKEIAKFGMEEVGRRASAKLERLRAVASDKKAKKILHA
jgi:hypothetical protein